MGQVFISYAGEDRTIAEAIARAAEAEGLTTWYFQRDVGVGEVYYEVIPAVIARCTVVVVIVSRVAVEKADRSNQITTELQQAFEQNKPFVPILAGLSHAEMQQRQPKWRHLLGGATSIQIPSEGLGAILLRVVDGLKRSCGMSPPGGGVPSAPGPQDAVDQQLSSLLAALQQSLAAQSDAFNPNAEELFRQVLPAEWTPPEIHDPPSPMLYARVLKHALPNRRTGFVPLLAFVQGLAMQADTDDNRALAKKLRQWLDFAIPRVCRLYPLLSEKSVRTALTEWSTGRGALGTQEDRPVLVVVIDTANTDGDRFWAEAWLFSDQQPVVRHLGATRHGLTREELRQEVAALRDEALRYAKYESLHIELLIPEVLSDCDADQWPVTRKPPATGFSPMGYEHPVVIRSLWRARCPLNELREAWAKRWESVGRLGAEVGLDDAGPVWNAVSSEESDAYFELEDRKDAVCAVLGLPPESTHPQRVPGYLTDALQMGLPIVLWLRQAPEQDEGRVVVELQRILRGQPLGEIWKRVWEERRKYRPSHPEHHVSRNISLVFDGPSRVPEGVVPPERAERVRGPQRKPNP